MYYVYHNYYNIILCLLQNVLLSIIFGTKLMLNEQ